jgi:hypothetical protein
VKEFTYYIHFTIWFYISAGLPFPKPKSIVIKENIGNQNFHLLAFPPFFSISGVFVL